MMSTFGNMDTLLKIDSGLTDTTYNLPQLASNTAYKWQIVAKDTLGDSAVSPLWSFTTSLRAIAETSAGIFDPTDPDDPAWNAVNQYSIGLFNGATQKLLPTGLDNITPQINLQAIKNDTALFLRLVWEDTSFSAWLDALYRL